MTVGSRSSKVMILTIGNGVNVLVNFLTLPFLIRTLSVSDYGTYGQVMMVIALLQGVFTFSFNQIANVHLSKTENAPADVFATLLRVALLMAAVGSLFMALITPALSVAFGNHQLSHLMLFSLVNLFGQVPVPIFMSVLVFYNRVQDTALLTVLSNLAKIAMMFIAIKGIGSVGALMVGLSIISVLQCLAYYLLIPAEIRKGGRYNQLLTRALFTMATPLVLSALVEKSLVYLDGIMISTMLDTANYAFYRAGAVEVPFIATLYGAVATIVMPEVARLFHAGNFNEIIRLKRTAISGTAFFVYPALVYLLFFSKPLMVFYLTDGYTASALIFAIFNLSLLIRINDYQDVLVISGNSRFIFFAVLTSSVVNLMLNALLIYFYGIKGSAIAFIGSLFLFAGILAWKSTKILSCSLNQLFDFRQKAMLLMVSALAAFCVQFLLDACGGDVLFIIFVSPVYAMVVMAIGWRLGLIPSSLKTQIASRFLKKSTS
jgi:O-antigen/teichoic acid export membrane protein